MKLKFCKKLTQGFSLIELIVAVSIMIIITSVALFNQAQFSSDILISNMAYEVALTIRQAQVYGISSKGNVNASEQYRVGYGVHFDSSTPGSFLSFIDVPELGGTPDLLGNTQFNYEYDAPTDSSNTYTDHVTDTLDLTQGEKIRSFCAHSGVSWDHCWDSKDINATKKSLDIVFVKPNPDAHIIFWDGTEFSGNIPNGVRYDKAKIVIESGLGDKCRAVTVYISGQVSVDPINPNIPDGGCGIDFSTLQ